MPHPSRVFWKNIKAKELREGVCEECEDKGLMAGGKEVREVKEVKEAKDRSDLALMTWSRRGERSALGKAVTPGRQAVILRSSHLQKDDPTSGKKMAAREGAAGTCCSINTSLKLPQPRGSCQENNISC
jgi:hypothetical protein